MNEYLYEDKTCKEYCAAHFNERNESIYHFCETILGNPNIFISADSNILFRYKDSENCYNFHHYSGYKQHH